MTRDKEGHCVMIKGLIQKEDIMIINAPNIGAPQYIRQMLTTIQGEINSNNCGIFNTLLTPIDRSSRQKINNETQAIKDTLDQMDLIHIYRAIHSETVDFTLFLKCTWNIIQDRSHLGSQIKP